MWVRKTGAVAGGKWSVSCRVSSGAATALLPTNTRTRGGGEISSHSRIKLSIFCSRRKTQKKWIGRILKLSFHFLKTASTNFSYKSSFPLPLPPSPHPYFCLSKKNREDRPCRKGMRNQVNIRWQRRGNLRRALAGRSRLIHRRSSVRVSLHQWHGSR